MTEYDVAEIIGGQYATSGVLGQQLYKSIHPQLMAGNSIKLDFQGVGVFVADFFAFAIAQLLQDFEPEILNTRVKIEGLSPAGWALLRRVATCPRDI